MIQVNHPFLRKTAERVKDGRFKTAGQRIYQYILSQLYQVSSREGISVMDRPWKYLIILDACRFDTFKEINQIDGILRKEISQGSSTAEWARKNFDSYHDLVYVSSNPHISNVEVRGFKGTNHFSKIKNVWSYGWNEDLNTVPPGEVTDAALEAKEEYPGKRMIVHYMQPHAPWIGETKVAGKELDLSYSEATDWVKRGGIWEKVEDLNLSLKFIRKAYRDNLKLVLEEVERLVNELRGRVVISSDHGECLGEKLLLEHPTGIYVKELVEIPWLVVENERDFEQKEETPRKISSLKATGKI